MQLELSHEEAQLLSEHLGRRITHLEEEVARTEKRTLQHELAMDIDRLRMIHEKIIAAASAISAHEHRRDEPADDDEQKYEGLPGHPAPAR